jgi:hypothetical protein
MEDVQLSALTEGGIEKVDRQATDRGGFGWMGGLNPDAWKQPAGVVSEGCVGFFCSVSIGLICAVCGCCSTSHSYDGCTYGED